MHAPHPYKVLFVSDTTAEFASLEQSIREAGESFELTHVSEAAVAQDGSSPHVRNWTPEVIAFGSNTQNPLSLARQLRQLSPKSQIVFLLPGERLERFRSALPFVPHLAGAWTFNNHSFHELPVLLKEAAQASRERAATAAVFDKINSQLTKRRSPQAEVRRAQLASSERYLAAVLTQSPDGFLAVDTDGAIIAWNESAARLLQIGSDHIGGTPLSELFPEEHRGEIHQLVASVLHEGSIAATELLLMSQQGRRPNYVELSVAPVHDEAGHITTLSITARDITARKGAEQELRELNETLEARVAQAVAELSESEEALRQAHKMEAIGQLTGGIAHDFNNLLQGIIGSLDIARRRLSQGRTSELDRFLISATTAANRAAALTHRLLAFARRQPLDPRPVDANQMVAQLEDLLRRTLGELITLEVVRAGGLWMTRCDPHQLESAILNLAINARDAMPEGGSLTIETRNAYLDSAYTAQEPEVRPGPYVCISVSDTGMGMPPEVIAKAFEPFFTTKPIGQGTGLGLSMIYGFARQSEGHAKIYSELGVGTTVKLYLPRRDGAGEETQDPPQLGTEHQAHASETVLVVEDEAVVRSLVVEVLSELGYQVIEAHDGPSGLAILQTSRQIDLLVTDIGLPGLNGRQVADAGRQLRPELKVLFMTGYAENAALASGFLEPGMQMITKPFTMESLAARVKQIGDG
jgi:PAS domain S-box-containing protein